MIEIILMGIILAVFVYGPLIVYMVGSWHWLRRYSDHMEGAGIRVRHLLIMSVIVGIVWSIMVSQLVVFAVLLTINLSGVESSVADAVITVAFLPAKVVFGIIALLPGIPEYNEAAFLHWALGTGLLIILLLASGSHLY